MISSKQNDSLADLLQAIKHDFQDLSPQLQSIATTLEKKREKLALMGIQDVARECAVQPSAVVRFAKRFGFRGFSALQALLKEHAHQQLSAVTEYQGRIRNLLEIKKEPISPIRLAHEVMAVSIEGLHKLERGLPDSDFVKAVEYKFLLTF